MNSYYIIFAVIVFAIAVVVSIFSKYKPNKQKKTDFLYTDALNAMLRADKRKAISLLKDIVKQDSDHIDAYLQLGIKHHCWQTNIRINPIVDDIQFGFSLLTL